MTADIEDLTPFFADRCWMFVLLAREASVAVILRRGPSQWVHVTLWDTRTDKFQSGQWFHGRIYPERCDVSPDGKLFIYFAGKFRQREVAKGYSYTWTAVSRPPYLTALTLWPIGDTWGGDGVFVDNTTVRVASGWSRILAPDPTRRYFACRKHSGDLTLERETDVRYHSGRQSTYALCRSRRACRLIRCHWVDWDQQGRLVASVGGRVLEGKLTKNRGLRWRQLAAMNEEQPVPMEAPEWARHW